MKELNNIILKCEDLKRGANEYKISCLNSLIDECKYWINNINTYNYYDFEEVQDVVSSLNNKLDRYSLNLF